MNLDQSIQLIAVAALPLLFAITLHEVAHGWVANKLGDSTAAMLGRLSINPTKHIDLVGTILVPIATLVLGGIIFGWAKPVPVNWNNLKNPRLDKALVSIAGPGANLLMALFWALIAKSILLYIPNPDNNIIRDSTNFFLLAAGFGIKINCLLLILNLLPIPPLDGSRVLASILPYKAARSYELIEPYGLLILLGLLFTGILSYLILPPTIYLISLIQSGFSLG